MPQPDPRKFAPGRLVQLLNSFPQLGVVTSASKLRRHREEAGFRISSDGATVDLLKYAAWLCNRRHAKKPSPTDAGDTSAFEEFVAKEKKEVDVILKGIPKP